MKIPFYFQPILLVLAINSSHAAEEKKFDNAFNKLNHINAPFCKTDETPDCTSLTAKICDGLKQNNGSFALASGNINLGPSDKSKMANSEKKYLTALASISGTLPSSLVSLKPMLENLKEILGREENTESWYSEVSTKRDEISKEIDAIAERDAKVAVNPADRAAEVSNARISVLDQISHLSMDAAGRWKKVSDVYASVKNDLLKVVDSLPISDAEKELRKNVINRTEIVYPRGVKLGGPIGKVIEQDCRTNMINAAYNPVDGKLTVCAGIVNSIDSESSLRFILAHELAHAINYSNLREEVYEGSSKTYKELNKVLAANGNLSCEAWAKSKEVLTEPAGAKTCGDEKYQKLVECLAAGKTKTVNDPDKFFKKINFCSLADKTTGAAYLNPNEFADRNYSKLFQDYKTDYEALGTSSGRKEFFPAFFLNQEIKCSPGIECDKAMEVSKKLSKASWDASDTFNCVEASSESQENESDWYAQRALVEFAKRDNGVESRREKVASSMALFCGYTYLQAPTEAQTHKMMADMVNLQAQMKRISAETDTHASDTDRLGGIFTDEMATLLECKKVSNPAKKSYQDCKI